jgi:hypothetical protein
MGWAFYYYNMAPDVYGSRLEPSDALDDFPGLTTLYMRLAWSYLEPEEGRFNWSYLDTPAQRWIDKGKQIALRIICCDMLTNEASWLRKQPGPYATPEWVKRAGAKGVFFHPWKGPAEDGPFWQPDFDDPVFLDKLDRFLAALAARYDGDPDVAFIDVGSFGVWGEAHTGMRGGKKYTGQTVRKHVDLYTKHFKRTLLVANDDFMSRPGGKEALDYARQKGMTLREDSVLNRGGDRAYFHAELAEPFWPHHPVILENTPWGLGHKRGNWDNGGIEYLRAVEDYHASYVSIFWWPREFYERNKELIAKINRRLGYRLQLVEASWPAEVRLGQRFRTATAWRNAGVAPCYPGGFPAMTLKDDRGGIVVTLVDEGFKVRDLPVGPPGEAETRRHRAEFELAADLVKPGQYDVFISVGSRIGTPRIALPLEAADGHRRYRLGRVEVLAAEAVAGDG